MGERRGNREGWKRRRQRFKGEGVKRRGKGHREVKGKFFNFFFQSRKTNTTDMLLTQLLHFYFFFLS